VYLGKQYSAKGIQDRCKPIEKLQSIQAIQQQAAKGLEAQNGATDREQKK